MIRLALVFAALLFAKPVAAYDVCHEMWFVRNLAFDRAGYCFGSALGQALFDNRDCLGKDVTLDPETQATVNLIRQQEQWMGCQIDTSVRMIDLPHAPLLRQLEDLPVPTDTASGCIGWNGPDIYLFAGHDTRAPIVARAQAGMSLHWEYDYAAPSRWEFISIYQDWELIGMGWSNSHIDTALCTQLAG